MMRLMELPVIGEEDFAAKLVGQTESMMRTHHAAIERAIIARLAMGDALTEMGLEIDEVGTALTVNGQRVWRGWWDRSGLTFRWMEANE